VFTSLCIEDATSSLARAWEPLMQGKREFACLAAFALFSLKIECLGLPYVPLQERKGKYKGRENRRLNFDNIETLPWLAQGMGMVMFNCKN
jgi:hypothetical protein